MIWADVKKTLERNPMGLPFHRVRLPGCDPVWLTDEQVKVMDIMSAGDLDCWKKHLPDLQHDGLWTWRLETNHLAIDLSPEGSPLINPKPGADLAKSLGFVNKLRKAFEKNEKRKPRPRPPASL